MRINYSVCYNESGDNLKDLFKIIFMVVLVIVVYLFKDNISNYIYDEIIYRGSNKVLTYNEYYTENNYLFVQNIDTSSVNNYQELLNMFYSIINSGDDSFSFDCNYDDCISQVNNLIKDEKIIANINNFVHPYNSFSSINIDIMNTGKITVTIKKVYSDEQIDFINAYIDKFISENINSSMSNLDKIKVFHDYIINNTVYDENGQNSHSYTAYNLITTGKSICGGYSDIMAIYLNKLGIKNYKITSENHIWNLVNLDDKWFHLDVTWDDPIASDGNQYLIHNFFMITSEELFNLDKVEHNYDKKIYIEAN